MMWRLSLILLSSFVFVQASKIPTAVTEDEVDEVVKVIDSVEEEKVVEEVNLKSE